jgi:hypothetical protein
MADASRVPLGVILVRRDASPVHPGETTTHTIDNMATDETGRRKCRKQAGERRGGKKKKDKIMSDGPRAIDFVENRGSKKSRLAESNPHPSIHLLLLLLPGNIGKY